MRSGYALELEPAAEQGGLPLPLLHYNMLSVHARPHLNDGVTMCCCCLLCLELGGTNVAGFRTNLHSSEMT